MEKAEEELREHYYTVHISRVIKTEEDIAWLLSWHSRHSKPESKMQTRNKMTCDCTTKKSLDEIYREHKDCCPSCGRETK